MADPRLYRVRLPVATATAALAAARQILAGCARAPVTVCVSGTLSLRALADVAALVPRARVDAAVVVPPASAASLAACVSDPQVDGWFLVQKMSAFGSSFWVSSGLRPADDPESTQLSLYFGGDPGQEVRERRRFGHWLHSLAAVGLLPSGVSPARLLNRFFAEVRVRPPTAGWRSMPDPAPVVTEGNVLVSSSAWRGTSRGSYGPVDLKLTVSLPPPHALSLAAPLLSGGGSLELHSFFDIHAGTAARLAATGTATFDVEAHHATLDENTVEALLAAVRDDLAVIKWDCAWPDEPAYLNGVVLTVNGVEGHDPRHTPGASAAYLSVHPRANDRYPDAYAARLARLAGIRLSLEPDE